MADANHDADTANETKINESSKNVFSNISGIEAKHKTAYRRVSKISDSAVLGIFIFMIFLPAALLTATGRISSPLSFESPAELPKASVQNYLDGTMTTGFQDWFSKSWPLRSTLVLAYNRFVYDFENLGASSAGSTNQNDKSTGDASEESGEPQEFVLLESNPMYADINRLRFEQDMVEPAGYRGTDQVIIGKSGYLYENGYINEFLGYSKMYRQVTRETIDEQVQMLEYIQQKLAQRKIAFVLVFSPSKASQYPDAIPEWYKAANSAPDDYVRPFAMMIERLSKSSINYIDSAALYQEVGLQETFPKTGIHWNKLAAFETINAILSSYENQTGNSVRKLGADSVLNSNNPPGFGNPEQDIFGLVYSSRPNADKITDDFYYWHDVYIENKEADRINVFVQGGSFTHDFNTYLPMYKISKRLRSLYYNQDEDLFASNRTADARWDKYLDDCDLVIFECNEQFVRGFGGNAPMWAQADKNGYDIGDRVYESLYNYLQRNS